MGGVACKQGRRQAENDCESTDGRQYSRQCGSFACAPLSYSCTILNAELAGLCVLVWGRQNNLQSVHHAGSAGKANSELWEAWRDGVATNEQKVSVEKQMVGSAKGGVPVLMLSSFGV